MSRLQHYSDDVNATYDHEHWDVGSVRYETAQAGATSVRSPTVAGPSEWVFVGVAAASALAQGEIVGYAAATADWTSVVRAPVSSPTARVIGVAQHAIAASSYGWVLKKGVGEVLADTGGITVDTALVVGNAVLGRADNVAAVTDHAFGYSTEAVAATALATCFISCP